MVNRLGLKHEVRARALRESFEIWGRGLAQGKTVRLRGLSKMYSRLTDDHYLVIGDAFLEMDDHKPGCYEWWWANNHHRYRKDISQRQQTTVHELMYNFLTDYVRGRLGTKKEKAAKEG